MTQHTISEITPGSFYFDEKSQYHVLKHFCEADHEYLSALADALQKKVTDTRKRMKLSGSKFNLSFASNPLEVLEKLKSDSDYSIEYLLLNKERIELRCTFHKNIYAEGIGRDALIEQSEFSPVEPIKTHMKNGFPIMYTHGKSPPTWELNIIFGLNNSSYYLVTLFPGKYAPPFPDRKKHSEKEFARHCDFWSRYIILLPPMN